MNSKLQNPLQKKLNDREWILADGATGTNLFNMGLSSGNAPEIWNRTEPKKIKALYQNSVDAGSDLFLTNSFGGNRSRLNLHGAENDAATFSQLSAEIGREVADSCSRSVIVAGSVGPTGEILEPIGKISYQTAVEVFHEQAEGLKKGGADVAWVETISAENELRAAAEAFSLADMEWCCTMSFDTAGRTMFGITTHQFVELISKIPNKPLAIGANCGVGASDMLRTILSISSTKTNLPIIAKGNAGIPKYNHGKLHYNGTPKLMSLYATLARDCGAKIIGGCCGTTPHHLRAMHQALLRHTKTEPPSLNTIKEALGEFSSISDGTDSAYPVRKRQNRRRLIP